MRGLNKVTLIGHLGKDPEVQSMEGGATVAKCTMATTEAYRDKEGNLHSETEWHNIVAWRKVADLAGKYLHKGSYIYVEGKLKTRSYESKEGITRYVTEVIADCLMMLDRADKADITAIDSE
jgi:single-strand DNA-binding protein